MIHAIIGLVRNVGSDVRDAGEMHDRIHSGEQGRPVDLPREIADLCRLDLDWKSLCDARAAART